MSNYTAFYTALMQCARKRGFYVDTGVTFIKLSISFQCKCFAAIKLTLRTNDSSVSGGNDFLGSRGEFDSGLLGLRVVGDHSGVVSGCASQLSTVTGLLLQTADDGTLRHDTNRQHIANVQLGYKSELQRDSEQHLNTALHG